MGSSVRRKANDNTRINSPISKSGIGSEGGGSQPADSNLLCPVSFKVPIIGGNIGAGVELSIDGDLIKTTDSGLQVGKLTTNIMKRIQNCSAMGITYKAVVSIDKQGQRHADFSQD